MISPIFTRLSVRYFAPKILLKQSPTYLFCSQSQLHQEVQAKVFEILKSAAKCDHSKLSRKATFQELGFDSLDSVELVVAMEENMGLDIPNEEAEKISTVEAAINTFYRHLNEKASGKKQGDK